MGKSKNEKELIEQVASMYYEKGISQADIAKQLYFSRAKISRLIKEAKENNYVKISVTRKNNRRPFLEEEFRKVFGIEDVVIVSANESIDSTLQEAANYIDRQIRPNEIVAISRGSTMCGIVEKLKPSEQLPITVVQIAGQMGFDRPGDEIMIARDFAKKYGGIYVNLMAPAFIDDEKDLEVLKKYSYIDEAIDLAKRADLLITSVAPFREEEVLKGHIDEKRRPVGTFVGRYIDANGNIIEGLTSKRVVGIDYEDIKKLREVVVVSFGEEKVPCLTACLRGKVMTKLVTDQRTAINILIYNGKMI